MNATSCCLPWLRFLYGSVSNQACHTAEACQSARDLMISHLVCCLASAFVIVFSLAGTVPHATARYMYVLVACDLRWYSSQKHSASGVKLTTMDDDFLASVFFLCRESERAAVDDGFLVFVFGFQMQLCNVCESATHAHLAHRCVHVIRACDSACKLH